MKKNKAFQKELHESGCQEVVKSGHGASKDLGSPCSGDCSHGKVELRRQMAAAAGKKSTTSLSLVIEAYGLEVEEEPSTLATQYWAEGVWTGKWHHEQREAWMRQIQEVQMWRHLRGPAGAVICETHDLGFKWPHWHTLVFSDETRIDMPNRCEKRCWCKGPVQSTGKSVQQSTSMKSGRREHGSNQLWLSCERK